MAGSKRTSEAGRSFSQEAEFLKEKKKRKEKREEKRRFKIPKIVRRVRNTPYELQTRKSSLAVYNKVVDYLMKRGIIPIEDRSICNGSQLMSKQLN